MVEIFAELEKLVAGELQLAESNLGDFYRTIRELIAELQSLAAIRGHRILLNELPPRFSGVPLKLNMPFIRKAIRELIINAMKFSPENSRITLLVENQHTGVIISVLNEPIVDTGLGRSGIPDEFRKAIFEPFFRISRTLHEQYRTLEYGLGLTLVDRVVQTHRGNIVCTKVTDFSAEESEARELISFEIELPT